MTILAGAGQDDFTDRGLVQMTILAGGWSR